MRPFRLGFALALLLGLHPALAAPSPAPIHFRVTQVTPANQSPRPAFLTLTARDGTGGFVRMDAQGGLHPCTSADNTLPRSGRTWCDYSFPLDPGQGFSLPAGQRLDSARLYLSIDSPLFLRVDEATGGLVQPDVANPDDPNTGILFDWVEFALDGSGFHGNTTCVDQFAIPITLAALDADGTLAGPVGILEGRTRLLCEYAATMPPAFAALMAPGGLRITAPGHAPGGPLATLLDPYVASIWEQHRTEPLVLTPDEGTFVGWTAPDGALVFTREGDPATYRLRAMPTTPQVFRCDGPLAQGNALEKVLGAQIAARLNRHSLEFPDPRHDPRRDYRTDPCNAYAHFWHLHGIQGLAYGFPYDDVNDRATLINTGQPVEIRIGFRVD